MTETPVSARDLETAVLRAAYQLAEDTCALESTQKKGGPAVIFANKRVNTSLSYLKGRSADLKNVPKHQRACQPDTDTIHPKSFTIKPLIPGDPA